MKEFLKTLLTDCSILKNLYGAAGMAGREADGVQAVKKFSFVYITLKENGFSSHVKDNTKSLSRTLVYKCDFSQYRQVTFYYCFRQPHEKCCIYFVFDSHVYLEATDRYT